MRKGRMEVLVAVVAVIASAQAPHPAAAGPPQKGVSLTLWDEDVNLTQLSSSLGNMAAAGVDHVAVNVWWFQQNINSTTIAADFTRYSASDDSVRAVIDAVHAAGMQVLLKPLFRKDTDSKSLRQVAVFVTAKLMPDPDGGATKPVNRPVIKLVGKEFREQLRESRRRANEGKNR